MAVAKRAIHIVRRADETSLAAGRASRRRCPRRRRRRCADRMVLWRIVHEQCVPAAAKGERAAQALPQSVAKADDAVIKDLNGVAQLLAIPTARVTGIEDPALLQPQTPDYFADAWRARAG